MPKKLAENKKKVLTVDTVAVVGFQAQMIPPERSVFVITPAGGYEDAEGNFVTVEQHEQVAVQGEELAEFMGTKLADLVTANPDITMYEALQTMMYSKL